MSAASAAWDGRDGLGLATALGRGWPWRPDEAATPAGTFSPTGPWAHGLHGSALTLGFGIASACTDLSGKTI